MEGRILTCVYCGMEYPQGTPASGELEYCRDQQSYYLAEFEAGNISEMELETMLELYYRRICELEK